MAVTIASLAAKLSLDNRAFVAGFAQSSKVAKGFGASISASLSSVVSSLGATIAASVTLGAAVHKLGSEMQSIDREAKLADRLGITFESMQKLSLAASLAGADVEILARGMLNMGRTIGSGGKPLDERFFEVADSLADISDAGERAKKSMEIFGRGVGMEILNTILARSGGIRESASAIDRFGLGISRIDAGKVEAANDALEVLGTVLSGVARKIAVEIAPAITSGVERTLTLLEKLGGSLDRVGVKFEFIGRVAFGITESIGTWVDFVEKVNRGDLGSILLGPSVNTDDLLDRYDKFLAGGSVPGAAGGGGMDEAIRKSLGTKSPMAADRGSIEAARIIQGSSTANAMPRLLEAILAELKTQTRNTDPVAAETRGVPSLQVATI